MSLCVRKESMFVLRNSNAHAEPWCHILISAHFCNTRPLKVFILTY